MKHIVKWGIIGLGNIAFEFAKAFYNADNAKLIAVASKSNEKLIKFKENFKLDNENLYDNYEKIIDNKEIDIYYIALPNSLHFEWAMRLIEKKKIFWLKNQLLFQFRKQKKFLVIKILKIYFLVRDICIDIILKF